MAEYTLQQFANHVIKYIERFFKKNGEILPMYHCVGSDGNEVVFPSPARDKDQAVAMVRVLLKSIEATRVAFIDEAWTLEQPTEEEAREAERVGIRNNPKRVEIVMISVEDANEGFLMATAKIIRHGNKAMLGKFEFVRDGGSWEGRMIGLLPTPERKVN